MVVAGLVGSVQALDLADVEAEPLGGLGLGHTTLVDAQLIDVNYSCRPCCLSSECYPTFSSRSHRAFGRRKAQARCAFTTSHAVRG